MIRTATSASLNPNALWSVFWLSIRQAVRAWKLIVLSVLFLIPTGLIIIGRSVADAPRPDEMEMAFILTMIPNALLPFCCLLFASSMIQDEIEEQTLTYLLMRPTPRWAIYLAKLAATFVTCSGLAALFTVVAYLALTLGNPAEIASTIRNRLPQAAALMALSAAGYCSFFALLSLMIKRSVIVGVIYIAVLEGWLANIDFAIRKVAIMYYFLVLRKGWLGTKDLPGVSIDLATSPSNASCVWIVLGAASIFALLGAMVFGSREFRVKTPEGS